MERIVGSIEVIAGEASLGIPVQAATPEVVPVIVEAVYGVRDVTVAEVVGGAVACWTAQTPMGEAARVILWPEADEAAPFQLLDEGGT